MGKLLSKPASTSVLSEAVRLLEGEPHWRQGLVAALAEENPGALLPKFLVAIGGVLAGDASVVASQLFNLASDPAFERGLRVWCGRELFARAGKRQLTAGLLKELDLLLAVSRPVAVIEVLAAVLSDRDGVLPLAHRMVARFFEVGLKEDQG